MMALSSAWTSQDLARELCNDFVAKGLLRANPAFIRTDREAKLVEIFTSVGLDGAKLLSIEDRTGLEVLVRQATQGEVWVKDIIQALAGMRPELATSTPAAQAATSSKKHSKAALEQQWLQHQQQPQQQNWESPGLQSQGQHEPMLSAQQWQQHQQLLLQQQQQWQWQLQWQLLQQHQQHQQHTQQLQQQQWWPDSPKTAPEDEDPAIEVEVKVVLPSGSETVVKLETRMSKPTCTVAVLRSKFTAQQPLPPGKEYKFLKGEALLGNLDPLENGDLITAVAGDSQMVGVRWPPLASGGHMGSFANSIRALNLVPMRSQREHLGHIG